MAIVLEIHKTYKYRLYTSKRDFRLHDTINISGIIWNHLTALQKRYYRRYKKHIAESRMKAHIAKLRMKTTMFSHWRKVGSQAVQELCERHESAYQRFFNKQGGLPRFKKVKKFKSFVLKQAGWELHEAKAGKKYRQITIDKTVYKFVYHRPMMGTIKTVTIKRDAAGRLWICFSVLETLEIEKCSTGKIGAFDFGLKVFLTTETGQAIDHPLFYRQNLPRLRQIQRRVSKKVNDSRNQQAGKLHIARRNIRIADKRRDFHFKKAHELCDRYDTLIFEDLNLAGMKKLWGRKVSDLAFRQFLTILRWVAFKRGKRIVTIHRFERTTGKCSGCGHKQNLELSERTFCCAKCGLTLDRDHNAALNILEAGHRLMLSQSEEDQVKNKASGAKGRSPHL